MSLASIFQACADPDVGNTAPFADQLDVRFGDLFAVEEGYIALLILTKTETRQPQWALLENTRGLVGKATYCQTQFMRIFVALLGDLDLDRNDDYLLVSQFA